MENWSRNKSEEFGLSLSDAAIEALGTMTSPGEVKRLLQEVADRGKEIRDPSRFVISRARNSASADKPQEKRAERRDRSRSRRGRRSRSRRHRSRRAEDSRGERADADLADRSIRRNRSDREENEIAAWADDLHLDLNDEALDLLTSTITAEDAKDLLSEIESKGTGKDGVRNPSGFVISNCKRIASGSGASRRSSHDGSRPNAGGKGGKSATRAAELGLDLSPAALDALATLQLKEAYELLDTIKAKGTGKGSIRNPSNYVTGAVEKINSRRDRSEGGDADRRDRSKGSKGGGKSAARAAELGLDLSSQALDALQSLRLSEALDMLEGIASNGSIRNPSHYIVKNVEKMQGGEGADGGKRDSGHAPPPGKGGKSSARAAEMGLDLDWKATEALASLPLGKAYDLLDSIEAKGTGKDGVRNPSRFIEKAVAGKGADDSFREARPAITGGKGGKSAARAAEMGFDLSQQAQEALSSIPLREAYDLLEDLASKGQGKDGIRHPSNWIIKAVDRMHGSKGADETLRDARPATTGGKGGKSAARAAEMGLELNQEAQDALSSLPLREAMDLLDSIDSKGKGKGGIRNPSKYIAAAVDKIHAGDKQMSTGIEDVPQHNSKGGGRGNKSATRAAEMGIDLSSTALDALSAIPLKEAYTLLEAIESKGKGKNGIRNPSGYITAAVDKILAEGPGRAPNGPPVGSLASEKTESGGGDKRDLEDRVLDINSRGLWGGDKIDVEALLALKALPAAESHGLLDTLEAKGSSVRDPSNYVRATIGKRGLARGGRKRSRPSSEAPKPTVRVPHSQPVGAAPDAGGRKPFSLWRGAAAKGRPSTASKGASKRRRSESGGKGRAMPKDDVGLDEIADRAAELGIELSRSAVEALAEAPTESAHYILDQVSAKKGIKNVSKYIVAACSRGIRTSESIDDGDDGARAAKRARTNVRPSKAPDSEAESVENE